MLYLNRNRLYFNRGRGDSYLYHTGTGIDGFCLVEDKVSDAIVDGLFLVVFYGLQAMGVVTYDAVGSRINDCPSLSALRQGWLLTVFDAPMGADNNIGGGVYGSQTADALAEAVDAFL